MTTPKNEQKHSIASCTSKSKEWYTPSFLTDRARLVMGAIDLDPASNERANAWIKATTYFTPFRNGLRQSWRGRVWLNPPFGRTTGPEWIGRLLQEYQAGNVTEACLLVAGRPTSKWFYDLWSYPMCWINKRVHFIDHTCKPQDQNTWPTVIVYLGPNIERFAAVFGEIGHIVYPTNQPNPR